MAELVAAFAASHAPLITAAPESADDDARASIHGAMHRLRDELRTSGATALVICSNEHFTNFFLDNLPPMCIGLGERHRGPVEAWLRVPDTWVPGQPGLAQHIIQHAFEHEFEPAFSHELRLDHGMMTVLHFLTPEMDLPVVPIIQNCAVKPMPTLRRCYRFGQELRQAIEAWDAPGERVALVGAGGLSHWVGEPRMGEVNETWDRQVLELFAEGRAETMLDWTEAQIEAAGNGAHEIRSWLTVAGAMAGHPARILSYQPVRAWSTGMGAVTYALAMS